MPSTGVENVLLPPTFSISSILPALNLSNNLLSISKITKNLNFLPYLLYTSRQSNKDDT